MPRRQTISKESKGKGKDASSGDKAKKPAKKKTSVDDNMEVVDQAKPKPKSKPKSKAQVKSPKAKASCGRGRGRLPSALLRKAARKSPRAPASLGLRETPVGDADGLWPAIRAADALRIA